jgi:hypothetical protein
VERHQGSTGRRRDAHELHDEPAPTLHPVDERADRGATNRNGHEADAEEEQHLARGCVASMLNRPSRERHGERGVARCHRACVRASRENRDTGWRAPESAARAVTGR